MDDLAERVPGWEERGVEQQRALSPLTFENGPGGEPLPREPASTHRP